MDLGANVNLLPYSVYQQLGLGELKPTRVTLQLADLSVKVPRGIMEDVLVQIDKLYFLVDFIVLDLGCIRGLNLLCQSSYVDHSLPHQMLSSTVEMKS